MRFNAIITITHQYYGKMRVIALYTCTSHILRVGELGRIMYIYKRIRC